MHKQVARESLFPLLELGAGTLNHVPYEPLKGAYDAVEPFEKLYQDRTNRLDRIRELYQTIDNVPEGKAYRRVISIAVLEHLEALPEIVASCATRMTADGVFLAGIPTEGGLTWELGWRCTTAPSFRLRNGLAYGPLMRHEHINTAEEIEEVLAHYFKHVDILRFPLPARHLSLYTYVRASGPRIPF